jgi:NAD(P)-dependent dehydrogenase (short-subunit alcohol dehydrogenase family)
VTRGLEGELAVATGGTSGIDLATTKRFTAEGAGLCNRRFQGSCAFDQEEASPAQRAKRVWQGGPVIDMKEAASCVGRHIQVAVAAEADPTAPGGTCLRRQKVRV